jgi:hypothetical protein
MKASVAPSIIKRSTIKARGLTHFSSFGERTQRRLFAISPNP